MDKAQEKRVLDANEVFYRVFRDADLEGMKQLWSSAHMVACIHPGWPALHGYAQVLKSFAAIMRSGAPPVQMTDARVMLLGEAAFVTCVEAIGAGKLVATNIFAQQDGRWRMVHHQAAPFHERDLDDIVTPSDGLN